MASITFALDDELKSRIESLSWIVWSELVRQELLRRQKLLKQFNSKEEQDLIKWSVDLGRRAKKGRFKRLLSELSPKEQEELLKGLSPEKRKEIFSE
jgi:hypothetical protein